LVALQYLQIGRVVNRVRFVEEMYELMNVFIYYKILTIQHRDNVLAIIFQKTISLSYQGRGKCLQLSQRVQSSKRATLLIECSFLRGLAT